MIDGLVINAQKGMYTVKTNKGIFKCRLRGKLFKAQQSQKSLVVAGDRVSMEPLHGDQGLITEIHPRYTKLSRKGAGKKGRHLEQVIAANIDQAVIVASVKNPSYTLNGLDRLIAAAEAGGLQPLICFNKADLIDAESIAADMEHYRRCGYPAAATSTLDGRGIPELRDLLKDKISVFAGSSGVGKSSLINSLLEGETAATGHVSTATSKGRHTTTSTCIYDIPTGGMIVDTPGMREFGLFAARDGVGELFSDIEDIAARCKFRDCSHTKEPGCAVREAMEAGELEEQRYYSYLKLINE